jgi:hypothetical protein
LLVKASVNFLVVFSDGSTSAFARVYRFERVSRLQVRPPLYPVRDNGQRGYKLVPEVLVHPVHDNGQRGLRWATSPSPRCWYTPSVAMAKGVSKMGYS